MIDTLLYIDYLAFHAINSLPHMQSTDMCARMISGVGAFGVIWFIFGGMVYIQEEKKHPQFFTPFFLAGVVSHVVASFLVKPWISRIRPSQLVTSIVVSETGGYSFPSTHATVSFALAEVLALYEPRFRIVWYTIALAISVSRVYLGVHYPSDILVGALLGYSIGKVSVSMQRLIAKMQKRR